MKHPYEDLLALPRHISSQHPQMSMRDRAAQFSPFAALAGYEAAIGEAARITEHRRELLEQEQADLNRCLTFLLATLDEQPEVRIEYFVPDERKTGGAYVAECGVVKRISLTERRISLKTGIVIPMDDIVKISVISKQVFGENE